MFSSPSDLFLKWAGYAACSPLGVRALVTPLGGRKVVLNRAERERTFGRILTERGARPPGGSGRRGRRRTSSNCATRAQLRTVVPGLPYVGSGRWRVCVCVSNVCVCDWRGLSKAKRCKCSDASPSRKCLLRWKRAGEQQARLSQCCPMFAKTHFHACGVFVERCSVCIVLLHCSISPAGCKGHKLCDCWTARDVIHPGLGHYITGL